MVLVEWSNWIQVLPRDLDPERKDDAGTRLTPGFGVSGSSDEAHTVNALATTGDERRGSLRKAPGSGQHALIRRSLNGETHPQGYPDLNP